MALLSAGRRVICARGDSDVWAVRAKWDMASNSVMASMYRLGFFMIGFGFIFVSPPEALCSFKPDGSASLAYLELWCDGRWEALPE